MKATEFWFWTITDQWGKRRKSPCRATADHALSMWGPSAIRIEDSLEVRMCPETEEEISGLAPVSPPRGSLEQQQAASAQTQARSSEGTG